MRARHWLALSFCPCTSSLGEVRRDPAVMGEPHMTESVARQKNKKAAYTCLFGSRTRKKLKRLNISIYTSRYVASRRVPARVGFPSPRVPENKFLEHAMKILDLHELAALLGRSPETIKKDIQRNPCAVPPRLHIPGTRLLRWREIDVDAWLADCVEGRTQGEGECK